MISTNWFNATPTAVHCVWVRQYRSLYVGDFALIFRYDARASWWFSISPTMLRGSARKTLREPTKCRERLPPRRKRSYRAVLAGSRPSRSSQRMVPQAIEAWVGNSGTNPDRIRSNRIQPRFFRQRGLARQCSKSARREYEASSSPVLGRRGRLRQGYRWLRRSSGRTPASHGRLLARSSDAQARCSSDVRLGNSLAISKWGGYARCDRADRWLIPQSL